jgi:hypothetical protein
MKVRIGSGLSAGAGVWLSFAAGALATGVPNTNTIANYSGPTVALAAGGNTAALPPGFPRYSTVAGTTVKAGDTVVWTAPTGNNWAFNGAPNCTTNTATLTGTLTGNGTSTLTCTLAGAGTATFVQTNNAAGAFAVALQGPAVAQLANARPFSNPDTIVPILVQNTGVAGGGTTPDPAPIAAGTLTSSELFSLSASGQTLGVDLTGAGLPAIPPGAGFNLTPLTGQPVAANGLPSQAVSTAGFLGTLQVNVSTFTTDARNALSLDTSNPLFTNGSLTGAVIVSLFGDFSTITNAYLLPNNSTPAGNQSSCAATPPGNAIAGTITATKNSIRFAGLGNPGNPASVNPVFSVCLVTNGTQVIQRSVGGPGTNFGNGIIATVSITGIGTPIPLTQPNQSFGSINYAGSVFFAQNVFGLANNYPVFFRAVNQGNTAAQVWAVLTKDVSNVVPESGAGSCTFPAGGSTAPATGTCNISFVANLTAVTDPTGLSQGLLQPNTGAYYLADSIAALAGTTLPAGNNKATIFLLSPSAGIQFSALSQSLTSGDIISLP